MAARDISRIHEGRAIPRAAEANPMPVAGIEDARYERRAHMTCKELSDFLDDYLAGELSPDVRGRFDGHLGECPDCVVYLRGYRETVGLLHEMGRDPDEEVPADVPAELVRAIVESRKR